MGLQIIRAGEAPPGPTPSSPPMAKRNRHPVDELADVRAQIAALKTREDELRGEIVAGACGAVGDQFEASVSNTSSERIDTAKLRKDFGEEKLKPYLKSTSAIVVRVTARAALDEAG